jgi:hypothetical protein
MKWRETCALQGISMPTHDELEQKLKDIKEAMIYEFKEEDIEKVSIITLCLFHEYLGHVNRLKHLPSTIKISETPYENATHLHCYGSR